LRAEGVGAPGGCHDLAVLEGQITIRQ
jgi:hypothetical protein